MSTIERAVEIAAFHPLRLMFNVSTPFEKIAAVLHDVVEDTPVTLDDLEKEGFHADVVAAVDALTKRKGESRIEAATRAAANPIARVVKLADVKDNMDLGRIAEPTDKDFERLKEYAAVKKLLLASIDS